MKIKSIIQISAITAVWLASVLAQAETEAQRAYRESRPDSDYSLINNPFVNQDIGSNDVSHSDGSRDLHVVFSADKLEYLIGAGVGIFSVMQKANPKDHYHFYVYVTEGLAIDGIPEEELGAFKQLEAMFPQCTIEFIPITYIKGTDGINFGPWGLAGALRIALPDLLPNIDHVIYMDCDMIAMKDLSALVNLIGFHDRKPIAAVVDIGGSSAAKRLCSQYQQCDFLEREYVNSGLLVMDLNHLRKEGFTESVYSWLREHQDAVLPDQDAINMVYKGKIKVIDFNYAWPSCWGTDPDNILIFHYLGTDNKPWNNPNGLNANFYHDFKEESPLADFESGHATPGRTLNFY